MVASASAAPFDALDTALAEAVTACPGHLLALCRQRIRMLLGGSLPERFAADPRFAALADYADSPLFDDTERVALEVTEQYVLDVAAMPGALIDQLADRLGGAGAYGFVMGLYAADQAERLERTCAVHRGDRQ